MCLFTSVFVLAARTYLFRNVTDAYFALLVRFEVLLCYEAR